MGYTPSVLAAEILLGPLDIPAVKYMYVCWMATWGASAAFLQKYAANEIPHTWSTTLLHAVKDVTNANLAALLTFLLCQHFGVAKELEAICYTLAGYGGARTLEWAYRKWVSAGNAFINSATGATGTPSADPVPPPIQTETESK